MYINGVSPFAFWNHHLHQTTSRGVVFPDGEAKRLTERKSWQSRSSVESHHFSEVKWSDIITSNSNVGEALRRQFVRCEILIYYYPFTWTFPNNLKRSPRLHASTRWISDSLTLLRFYEIDIKRGAVRNSELNYSAHVWYSTAEKFKHYISYCFRYCFVILVLQSILPKWLLQIMETSIQTGLLYLYNTRQKS